MTSRNFYRSILLLLTAIFLMTGCGGSGALGKTNAKVTIVWPDISRGIEAPKYAQSAQISLLIGSSQTPSRWFVDRPNGTTPQTLTYTSPDLGATGPALLQVVFFQNAGGTGVQVAAASVSVSISPDGTLMNSAGGALGNVTYGSTLGQIMLNESEISVGQSKPLIVTSQGFPGVIAIPQSLVTMTLDGTSTGATLTDGVLTGVAEGLARLHVVCEGITQDFDLSVLPSAANTEFLNFPANHIAWDSVHGRFWGTFGPSSPYPNSIVDIDPVNGAIGSPIAVGSNPNNIAVSADGSMAYVGVDGAFGMCPVNLGSRIAGALIPLAIGLNPAKAAYVDVDPTNANEFATCLSQDQSGTGALAVFRNGVQVASVQNNNSLSKAIYTSGSTLFATDTGSISTYSVGVSSISQIQTMSYDSYPFSYADLSLYGSKVILSGGRTFDISNLGQIGFISYSTDSLLGTATDSSHDLAWSLFTQPQGNPQRLFLRAISLSTFAPVAAVTLPFNVGNPGNSGFVQMKRYGVNGVGILTTDGLRLVHDLPGLPPSP